MTEALEKVRHTKGRLTKIFEMKDIVAGKKRLLKKLKLLKILKQEN